MTQTFTVVPLFDGLTNLTQTVDTHAAFLHRLPPTLKPSEAEHDYIKTSHFLFAYRHNKETFNAYRREVERLVQWSWFIKAKPLSALNREDIELYLTFCQSPPKEWVGVKHVPRFLAQAGRRMPNPAWRPFIRVQHKKNQSKWQPTCTLSLKSIQAIFSILTSFFHYLVQENHAQLNPIALMRQKNQFLRKYQSKRPIRRLSELQWVYVLQTTEMLATQNPRVHERTLFIMNALFGMYLRISELAATERWQPQMGHFYSDQDGNWWFKTLGKGNKERDISVSNAMLAALKRYRKHLHLTSLPQPGETTPLLIKLQGKGAISGTRHIRKLAQYSFNQTILRLKQDGFNDEAESLTAATVHWLRHTGISEDVKIRPREHVRDDAGHSSSAITDQYVDIELRERHASAKLKRIKY